MTQGFLANVNSVLEKAGEAVTEAEGFSEKLETKYTVLWPIGSQTMVLQQWKLQISESWPHDLGVTIGTNESIEIYRLKIRGIRTVKQSAFFKVIHPRRVMGNENNSKSRHNSSLFQC